MKSLLIAVISLVLAQGCLAATCPSISDIKSNTLVGWKAYDSDDGSPLSPAREARFKQMMQHFALAEWKRGKNMLNTMHCYYRDSTGSSLEAYLAKDNFTPPQKDRKNFWYQVSGAMQCAAGKNKCQFAESQPFAKHQLAKR